MIIIRRMMLLIPHVVRVAQYLRILLYVFVLRRMKPVSFLLKSWNSLWEATVKSFRNATTTTVLSLYNNDLFKIHRRVFLIIYLVSTQRTQNCWRRNRFPLSKCLQWKCKWESTGKLIKQVHCTCMKYPIIAHSVAIPGEKCLSTFIILASNLCCDSALPWNDIAFRLL